MLCIRGELPFASALPLLLGLKTFDPDSAFSDVRSWLLDSRGEIYRDAYRLNVSHHSAASRRLPCSNHMHQGSVRGRRNRAVS